MDDTKIVDYRQLRLHTLNEPRYAHLKLLLFWPSFGIVFFILERVWIRDSYHIMSCPLDAHIPFCEWFVIPYFFWFIFIIGMHVYTLLYDVPTFRRFIRYLAITYWASVAVYILFPTVRSSARWNSPGTTGWCMWCSFSTASTPIPTSAPPSMWSALWR